MGNKEFNNERTVDNKEFSNERNAGNTILAMKEMWGIRDHILEASSASDFNESGVECSGATRSAP